jgi:hypothetical protein
VAREIGSILIRNSLEAVRTTDPECARCRRIPLVGEWLYELGSGTRVCSLCVAQAADREGEPVGAERVRSCERRLAVVQQPAA